LFLNPKKNVFFLFDVLLLSKKNENDEKVLLNFKTGKINKNYRNNVQPKANTQKHEHTNGGFKRKPQNPPKGRGQQNNMS
jgi:hypothetical protein